MRYKRLEYVLHVLFWAFVFSAVNVDWGRDWFDRSLRPNTPAPLAVLIFPAMFYAHACWALPVLLKTRNWLGYVLSLGVIFLLPELVRLVLTEIFLGRSWVLELRSRDSFILGNPNAAWMAFAFSSAFRFTKDWFVHHNPKHSRGTANARGGARGAAVSSPETKDLRKQLAHVMDNDRLFLDEHLSLRTLADRLNVTDKKLSALLNQNLKTNFSDFIHGYRVAHFIEQVESGQLRHLSIAGLARQCGFSSKTTFYRSFRKVKGCTPTDFLQAQRSS